ncbi:SprT family zinc-dependent metalloprotease [Ruminococcus sp.]|uniref:M48 family metallopeptidase n=1 Tax=Ruminococcus sp. TaxID=41978 RepID=UPI0025F8F162|nr:SprT family zinc-dependent metalloprotease [Ruminococcus sp.]MCR4637703.1 M48 family metallopeptidase [Ruminococcus sp.]
MKAISTETRRVLTPSGAMDYTLERKKVKNINLRVKHDGSVCVSAPKRVPVREIEAFIISRSEYIRRAAVYFAEHDVKKTPPSYMDGESLMYLGKPLRLTIIADSREYADMCGDELQVHVREADDTQRVKKLAEGWYDKQCREVFSEIVLEVQEKFRKYGVPQPQLKLRSMTSRWGSCHYTKGIITLNRRLIEAPRHCIEHVVTHEFCHFIHPDHSKDFYALLGAEFPQWRSAKAELEKTVIL